MATGIRIVSRRRFLICGVCDECAPRCILRSRWIIYERLSHFDRGTSENFEAIECLDVIGRGPRRAYRAPSFTERVV